MAKKVYKNTVLSWAKDNKLVAGGTISGAVLIGLYFVFLASTGAITITGYSNDTICAGTIQDPCYAYINFTANEDIFLYPLDYDPYNRDTGINFNPDIKDWKLERSWGSGWREIDLNKTCTATWCGASGTDPNNAYSFAFRQGNDYQIRITAYKNHPSDNIKWTAFGADPYFFGNDSSIKYNASKREISVRDKTFNQSIFTAKLESQPLEQVRVGYQKFAEFSVDKRVSNYLLDSVEFYDLKNGGKQVNRTVDVKYKSLNSVPVYEFHCLNANTSNESCTKVQTGTTYQEEWLPFNNSVKGNNFTIGLFTNVSPEETIEWVPTILGTRIDEWAVFTSGNVTTTDGLYTVVTYLNSGTFNTTENITNTSVLVIAGGGGAGKAFAHTAGGGGSGGYIYNTSYTIPVGNYTISVGSGGTGASTNDFSGSSGDNSSFSVSSYFQANGGGGGGGFSQSIGKDGGSGGGGHSEGTTTGGTAVPSWQGHNGLDGPDSSGGGCGSVGSGNDGGAGCTNSINGTSVSYAKGGGYGSTFGATNTRNGFGDGGNASAASRDGGSGIVIIRYLSPAISLTLTAPANKTNFSTQTVVLSVNVSVSGGGSVKNVTLNTYFSNGTLAFTSTNTSASTGIYNFSNTYSDGNNYFWNATGYDSSNSIYFSDTTRYFSIDTTNPQVSYNPTAINDSTILAVNYALVNISASDLNLHNVRLNWNGTNETFSSNDSSTNYWSNKTGLADGNYTFYGWANDTFGHYNLTFVRSILIDTTAPTISLVSPSVNNSYSSGNSIFVQVQVNETNPKNVTYTLENGSIWNSTTYLMSTNSSNLTINFTNLAKGNYRVNATVWDVANNTASTDTFYVGFTTLDLFFNGFEGNNTAELGGNYSLLANSTANLTLCVDIIHPDFGVNYSCSANNTNTFNFSIDYFRNKTFADGLTYNLSNHSGYTATNLTVNSHQFDELDSLTFNITGLFNPLDTTLFLVNSSPDVSNQTQYEPLIDRFYDGYLNGSNVYTWQFYDNTNITNLTYLSGGDKTVYFLLDDILSSRTHYSFLLNITGYLIGSGLQFGNSTAGYEGFSNYSSIDTTLTSAQLDPSGVIMAKNLTNTDYVYDDFEDASVNQSKWANTSYQSSFGPFGELSSTVTESAGNLVVYAHDADTGSANATAWSTPNLSRIESDVINASYTTNYVGNCAAGFATQIVSFGGQTLWNLTDYSTPNEFGSEGATVDMNVSISKVNYTYWKYVLYGWENLTATSRSPMNIHYVLGTVHYIQPTSSTLGFSNIASDNGCGGTIDSTIFASNVNRTSWTRQNSTVISNAVYDSSQGIDSAYWWVWLKKPDNGNVTIYLSNDDGLNWGLVGYYGGAAATGFINGVNTFADATGQHLRWRADFNDTSWSNQTIQIYQVNITIPQSNVSDVTFDWGDDGTVDATLLGNVSGINGTLTVNLSDVNLTSSFNSSNRFTNLGDPLPHTYKIPLTIHSETRGVLEIKQINLTYDPNPVSVNITRGQSVLDNSTNYTLLRIPIASNNGTSSQAQINVTDLRRDYAGGNQTILFTIHDPAYTISKTFNLTYYYSRWEYFFQPTSVDFIEFIPSSSTSKNVTAFGQTPTKPLLNLTNYGYGGKNTNWSIYVNDTSSCVGLTLGTNSSKIYGKTLGENWTEFANNTPYLGNQTIYLWADYSCTSQGNWSLFNPSFFFRQCANGTLCSSDIT